MGIMGHSRYGKAAVVTEADDPKFAIGYISARLRCGDIVFDLKRMAGREDAFCPLNPVPPGRRLGTPAIAHSKNMPLPVGIIFPFKKAKLSDANPIRFGLFMVVNAHFSPSAERETGQEQIECGGVRRGE